jgi:hypothetical protein
MGLMILKLYIKEIGCGLVQTGPGQRAMAGSLGRIYGSHSGRYEQYYLLGYNAV